MSNFLRKDTFIAIQTLRLINHSLSSSLAKNQSYFINPISCHWKQVIPRQRETSIRTGLGTRCCTFKCPLLQCPKLFYALHFWSKRHQLYSLLWSNEGQPWMCFQCDPNLAILCNSWTVWHCRGWIISASPACHSLPSLKVERLALQVSRLVIAGLPRSLEA